jgi:hypothetical protein
VVDAVGSGGIAWLGDGQGAGRLITGACSTVDSIALSDDPHGNVAVASRADVTRLLDLPGCVTTVKQRGDAVAIGVFTFGGSPRLVLLDAPRP